MTNPPPTWRRSQLRHLVKIKNGADYRAVEVSEGGYPVYGSGGQFRRANSYLHDGASVLFGRKGTVNKPLLVSGKFWTVDTMFYTVIGSSVDPRFLHYAAATIPYEYYQTNTAVPSITQTDLAGHRIAVPDIAEQERIADYLDRETAQIDALIAKQEQLIATLRERRLAVIEHTLSSLAARADTVMTPIRHLGATTSGAGFPPAEQGQKDLDIPFFKVKHLSTNGQLTRDVADDTITAETAAKLRATVFPPGTICYAKVGAALLLGRFRRTSVAACIDNNMSGLVPNDRTIPEFLQWALTSVRLDALVNPGAVPSLSDRKFVEWELPVPPITAQHMIDQTLREQTANIDTLIAKAERFIELSKERRAALITAAVTGQLEIPG